MHVSARINSTYLSGLGSSSSFAGIGIPRPDMILAWDDELYIVAAPLLYSDISEVLICEPGLAGTWPNGETPDTTQGKALAILLLR